MDTLNESLCLEQFVGAACHEPGPQPTSGAAAVLTAPGGLPGATSPSTVTTLHGPHHPPPGPPPQRRQTHHDLERVKPHRTDLTGNLYLA